MYKAARNTILLLSAFLLFTAEKCSQEKYKYSEETQIEMSKTACFGKCPVYSITIKGNGEATYNGKRFVKVEGEQQRTFPADTINQLFNAFAEADLWQYKDEYTDDITDLPTTYLTFQHKGQQKRIKMYYGFPEKLEELTEMVEELALSEGWQ